MTATATPDTTASTTPATAIAPLPDEAGIAAFHRDGFLVRRGLFDAAEMADIARWTDEVQGWPETPGRQMMYFEQSLRDGARILDRMENFAPFHEGFDRLFNDRRLKGAVSALLGEPAVLYKEKINFKLPGGDGFKPHQDQQAGWGVYADYFITALVSVDEATLENGCLEVVAGHHQRGLVGGEWKPLDDDDLAGMEMVPCPSLPGDVVFFDSFTPHGSGPNLSDQMRRVVYITWNRASAGDHRAQYYADKRRSFPPDIEREPGREYVFRV